MTRYLLDTIAFICLIGQKSERLIRRIFSGAEGEIGLSTVVLHELYFGAYRSQRWNSTLRIYVFSHRISPWSPQSAGDVMGKPASIGTPIGPFDVLIAGQAKARSLAVITNNRREFQRVERLHVEDWAAAA